MRRREGKPRCARNCGVAPRWAASMRGFRLNGWQRIGIVLSVQWAIVVGGFLIYMGAVDADRQLRWASRARGDTGGLGRARRLAFLLSTYLVAACEVITAPTATWTCVYYLTSGTYVWTRLNGGSNRTGRTTTPFERAFRARCPPTARTETLWTSSFGRAASLQSS